MSKLSNQLSSPILIVIITIAIIIYGNNCDNKQVAKTWDINNGDGIAMLYCGDCTDKESRKYIVNFMNCTRDCPQAIKMTEMSNKYKSNLDDCLLRLHELMKEFRKNAKPDDYKRNDTCSIELDEHRDQILKCAS
ncbi:uncharacterized protein LOC128951439 [Oppia nitens]|uniref:uncharacterized protein LOC128951439 n=1 Tax=Oppia nitens TaxID=1686743 RepID=UPI0023DBE673|nr:uncharacterized protein LOC128951439 [Oppia nitens]